MDLKKRSGEWLKAEVVVKKEKGGRAGQKEKKDRDGSSSTFASSSDEEANLKLLQSQCLAVPSSAFISSLKSTIDIALSCWIFAADDLSWSLSAIQNPKGKDNGTGDLGSDLKTWLSSTFTNQDTCIEGFVAPKGKSNGGGGGVKHVGSGDFPSWVGKHSRKLLQASSLSPDVTVAADGTGNYTTVMDAVQAAPDYSQNHYVIYIKQGIYRENVEIKKKKWNLMMVGDGMGATVITGNRSYIDGWTTYASATFAVKGKGFIARDMTFENTAGPEKHQAVALRSDSDLSVYYRCSMRGYQDTLYPHTNRQFYRECRISGTVDFIFGDATVVFQNCQILVKKGLPNQKNTITAQGRKDPAQPTGFSIQFSNISADSDLLASVNSTLSYLGRPWKQYSRTIIMKSYISDAIRPEGWLEWNGDFALDTLYYGEYMNYGPSAGLGSRVQWPGFHLLNNSAQAANFTVTEFIAGNLWLPSTGVKYSAGLAV
ncbi:Pectinesterase/pectinesterase inhibitor PPE8B [Vitis vinifera]|uniref:Pectinesterase n=1 Tax=Vitis vinifera TaxID=29760 RepID=A0A438E9S0_VITVI|nr:Pectinesterase/pectinesterase inhibitor PPE8B [Vitis vinifera]